MKPGIVNGGWRNFSMMNRVIALFTILVGATIASATANGQTPLSPPAVKWGGGGTQTPLPFQLIGYDSSTGLACIVGSTGNCALATGNATLAAATTGPTPLTPPAVKWGGAGTQVPAPSQIVGYDSSSGAPCIVGSTATCAIPTSGGGLPTAVPNSLVGYNGAGVLGAYTSPTISGTLTATSVVGSTSVLAQGNNGTGRGIALGVLGAVADISMGNDVKLAWTSGTNPTAGGTEDTILCRQAAGIVEFGTTACNALGGIQAASAALGGAASGGNALAVAGTVNLFNTSDFQLSLNATGQFTTLNLDNGGNIRGQLLWDNTNSVFNIGSTLLNSTVSLRVSNNIQGASLSAGAFHLGAADAATAVAQTLGVQGVAAGNLNVAGANFTIAGSQGTGTGIGGSLLFQTAPAGSTGTSQNALVTALTIDSAGNIQQNITSAALYIGGNASTGIQLASSGGLFFNVPGNHRFLMANDDSFQVNSDGAFCASSGNVGVSGCDTSLSRKAAANWRMGQADAASPVAQTISMQNVVAGTSNTAGANFTLAMSQGTGTGAGGSFIVQVAPAGGSGTTQNALATALTIDSTKLATFAGTVKFAASTTGAGAQTFTNSPCSTLNSEQWITVQITGQTGTWNIPACQ